MTSSESVVLRKELAAKHGIIEKHDARIADLKKEIAEMKKVFSRCTCGATGNPKLDFYESSNMPSSSISLYNAERKAFRERRGEDPGGNPGDPARGKKRGPPDGHPGYSHKNKPECSVRYPMHTMTCECGGQLVPKRPVSKLVSDLDEELKVHTITAVIDRAECAKCGRITHARTPFIPGTSLGPVLLGKIIDLFKGKTTDGFAADLMYWWFHFKLTESTIYGARRAITAYLRKDMIQVIKQHIEGQPFVQFDESMFKRGDGHYGYVWVACTKDAVQVEFATSRSSVVLDDHFGDLEGKPAVCDGYSAYAGFCGPRQRCWRHAIGEYEKVAVRNGGRDEALYNDFKQLYHDAKKTGALAPLTLMDLRRRVYRIAASGNDKMRTLLLGALPNLFTFLQYEGMPPHNNDAEIEIRDGIVTQRNVRHKIGTPGAKRTFSDMLTFTRTCNKQNVHAGRAFMEYVIDPDWNIFENAPHMADSFVNPDGTRYSMFAGLDPPEPPGAARPTPAAAAPVSAV